LQDLDGEQPMDSRSSAGGRDDFKKARRDFESWRRRRPWGARIPERLWRSAVDLAGKHGVSKTALTLRLDYYALKKRLESESKAKCGQERRGLGFVEMPLAGWASTPACVLEILDERGTRLRVEAQGLSPAELESLARALLGQPR